MPDNLAMQAEAFPHEKVTGCLQGAWPGACSHLLARPPMAPADVACWRVLLPIVRLLLATNSTPGHELAALAGCMSGGLLPALLGTVQRVRKQQLPGAGAVEHHAADGCMAEVPRAVCCLRLLPLQHCKRAVAQLCYDVPALTESASWFTTPRRQARWNGN